MSIKHSVKTVWIPPPPKKKRCPDSLKHHACGDTDDNIAMDSTITR